MFLVTTAIPEFRPREDPSVLLGPWCLDGRTAAPADGAMLPNIWDDRRLLRDSARICTEKYAVLRSRLAAKLNGIHGVDGSDRYWDILIGPWLTYSIHHYYDRLIQVRAALRLHPGLTSLTLDSADYVTPTDSADFLRLFTSDYYNLQIYSQVLSHLGVKTETARTPLTARLKQGRPASPPPRLRARLAGLFRSACDAAVRRGFASTATDQLYPSGSLLWTFVARSRFSALPFHPAPLPAPPAPSRDGLRAGLASIAADDEFERLFVSALPYSFPALFLEGYAAARAQTEQAYPLPPRLAFVGSSMYYEDPVKFAVAEWSRKGSRVLGFQHGGQYGTAEYSLAEEHERRISDRYFTWGWSAQENDPKLGDLPVPKYSEGRRRRPFPWSESSRDILVVCAEGLKNAHHLFPYPMGGQWDRYFDWRCRFIGALPAERRPRLRIRHSPNEYGWRQKERLAARFPAVRLDDVGVPFTRSCDEARWVVTDHPGTTFLECLALNRPGTHYWDPELWELRPAAVPLFEELRAAGIVHYSPEDAARFIAETDDTVRSWWQSPRVQSARARFVETYARTSDDWASDWVRAVAGERGAK